MLFVRLMPAVNVLIQAVFEEINAQQRPDLVKQTDRLTRGQRPEDTLSQFRQIQVPQPGPTEYFTGKSTVHVILLYTFAARYFF